MRPDTLIIVCIIMLLNISNGHDHSLQSKTSSPQTRMRGLNHPTVAVRIMRRRKRPKKSLVTTDDKSILRSGDLDQICEAG